MGSHAPTRRQTLGLLGALPLASCLPEAVEAASSTPAPAPPWPAPPEAGLRPLTLVAPWEVGGLSPLRSGHLFVRLQVAETLVDTDPQGRLRPGLATSWEVTADGLTWTFRLRTGARFHHGPAVRPHDVVQSLQRARTPPGLLASLPILAMEALDASGTASTGPGAVRIRLTRPLHSLPQWLTHPTTLVLSHDSLNARGEVTRLLASGPYRVSRHAPPQSLWLEAAEPLVAPRAVRAVHYLAAGRAETRALMALGRQADLAHGLDPVSLTRVRRSPLLQVQGVTTPRTVVIKLNAAHPALRDVRVRQALSLAIDRQGMARALLRDPSMAASQLLPPSLPDWHDTRLPPLTLNLDAARQQLQDAGWQWQGQTWWHRQHGPLRLTLLTYPDRPELPLLATALQAQWRALGIAVQVRVGNSGDIPLGHRDGSLDMALIARQYGSLPDPAGTLRQDFGPQGSDWGAMHWHDPAVVTALDRLVHDHHTSAQAQGLRRQVLQGLQAALPVVPVCWVRQQVAIGPRVEGLVLDPLERSYRLTDLRWRS